MVEDDQVQQLSANKKHAATVESKGGDGDGSNSKRMCLTVD